MLRLQVLAATVVLAGCSGNSLPPGGASDMSTPDLSLPAPCSNGFLDSDETDTDCGGSCEPCSTGKSCKGAKDCESGICANRMCAAPTCIDMVKNGTESDVDCGGSCMTKCAEGKRCNDGPDCASLTCVNGMCAKSPCEDGMLDAMETDVDCGGPVCMTKCGDGKMCVDGTDCASGMCINQRCKSNCPAGTGDCDGDPGNGCETNTNTDAKNCGSCRVVCQALMPACIAGKCSGSATASWSDPASGTCTGTTSTRMGSIRDLMPMAAVTVTITAVQLMPQQNFGSWTGRFPMTTCVRLWLDAWATHKVKALDDTTPMCQALDDQGVSYNFIARQADNNAATTQAAIYPTNAPGAFAYSKVYFIDRPNEMFGPCDLAGVNNRQGFEGMGEYTNTNKGGVVGDAITFSW